jgi:hypothetical protein
VEEGISGKTSCSTRYLVQTPETIEERPSRAVVFYPAVTDEKTPEQFFAPVFLLLE